MKYTVLWKTTAENALAAYWTDANSELKQSITETINAVDAQLKKDPFVISESRQGTERIVAEPPVVLAIDVLEEDRQVIVLSLRIIPDHPAS